jgi:glycosyltransferase involved in cell wall biosynthesis
VNSRIPRFHICIVAPFVHTLPLVGYGGTEVVVWESAAGLAARGHKVTLLALSGSKAPPGVRLLDWPIHHEDIEAFAAHAGQIKGDTLIVDHAWKKPSYVEKRKRPWLRVAGVAHFMPVNPFWPAGVSEPCVVGVSKAHADGMRKAFGVGTRYILNGVDTAFYAPTGAERNERYVFLGHVARHKGVHIAARIAYRAGVGLDVIGPCVPAAYRQDVEAEGGDVRFLGEMSRKDVVQVLSSRKALLHPVLCDEAFGLALVEAQACGLPVIAFGRGGIPEVVKDGETGFLPKTEEEMERLVKDDAVSRIDRARCRTWASQFSIERMVDGYEALCLDLFCGREW